MRLNRLYFILYFLLFTQFIQAEENYLNIDAAHFEADQKNNIMIFKGDVKMTQNNDILKCQLLHINTKISSDGKKRQIPKDFKATGDVSFALHTAGTIYRVKGDTVLYYPQEQRYEVIGNAFLEDVNGGKKLTAQKIYIDSKTGHTKIDGDKNKPIKFRLKLSDINN